MAADYIHNLKAFPDLLSHFMADLTILGASIGHDIIKIGDEACLTKDFKECCLIENELKVIFKSDKTKLEKKMTTYLSKKVATKMLLVDQNKFPIQLAKLQANAYFK